MRRAMRGPPSWREIANRLVAERLLLAEDADRLIAAARESWDVYRAL